MSEHAPIEIRQGENGSPLVTCAGRTWTTDPWSGTNPGPLVADLWFFGPDRMPEHWPLATRKVQP